MTWLQIVMIILACVALAAAIVFFVPKGPEYVWLDLTMFGIFTAVCAAAVTLAILNGEGVIGHELEPEAVRPNLPHVSERSAVAMGRDVL